MGYKITYLVVAFINMMVVVGDDWEMVLHTGQIVRCRNGTHPTLNVLHQSGQRLPFWPRNSFSSRHSG